jgi:hypothetical protein
MSNTVHMHSVPESEQMIPYRALSRAAVVSMVLALLGAFAFLTPALVAVPLGGALFGVVALINIRRFPLELTGKTLAWIGLVTCLLLLVSATALHVYVYVTEVPEGYQPIGFSQLQPPSDRPAAIPAEALELDGKRVFVKGYVHPGVASQGDIQEFILVPDMGTCCFGGQPKVTDMITVTLRAPLRTRYNQRIRKLGGVLRVSNQVKPVAGGLNGGVYELDADYLY